MRNFSLGVGRRDAFIFAGATILVILLTIGWNLFLVDIIGTQALNKYFLTVVLFGLALVLAVFSTVVAGRSAGVRGMLPSLMTRFGLALQIFGIMITPIGLYYATNPTRSVPVGFAAFSSVIIGIIIAGVGGNMLVPRRA
jgi:hypothetical protein